MSQYATAVDASTKSEFHNVAVTTRNDGCGLLVHVENCNPDMWLTIEFAVEQNQNMVSMDSVI